MGTTHMHEGGGGGGVGKVWSDQRRYLNIFSSSDSSLSDPQYYCDCSSLAMVVRENHFQEQVLCFLMEKVDILGTALWKLTIL